MQVSGNILDLSAIFRFSKLLLLIENAMFFPFAICKNFKIVSKYKLSRSLKKTTYDKPPTTLEPAIFGL